MRELDRFSTAVSQTGAMFTPPVVGKVQPEPSLPEYKRNEKCKGVAGNSIALTAVIFTRSRSPFSRIVFTLICAGDLNLEPPPVPEEGQAAAE